VSTLLLAPLPVEHSQLAQALQQKWRHELVRVVTREIIFFPEQNIYLGLGGHGKVEMALATQFWLRELPGIKKMACIGCAGSLSPSVQVGEIVACTQTIEHDYRQIFIKKPLPAFASSQSWHDLLQRFPKPLLQGPIASGDEDVLSPARRQEIHSQTQALAVAWEGAGAARACRLAKVDFCEIRGITDSFNTNISQDFTKNLNQVMLKIANGLELIF
jgi:adenosylhomocysteine nucleosidase